MKREEESNRTVSCLPQSDEPKSRAFQPEPEMIALKMGDRPRAKCEIRTFKKITHKMKPSRFAALTLLSVTLLAAAPIHPSTGTHHSINSNHNYNSNNNNNNNFLGTSKHHFPAANYATYAQNPNSLTLPFGPGGAPAANNANPSDNPPHGNYPSNNNNNINDVQTQAQPSSPQQQQEQQQQQLNIQPALVGIQQTPSNLDQQLANAATNSNLGNGFDSPQNNLGPRSLDRMSSPGIVDNQMIMMNNNNNVNNLNSNGNGPIFRFQAQALNSTSVRLVWSVSIGYTIDFFDIQYGPTSDVNVFSLSKLNGTQRDYTFHQLQPDTTYQFQLQAYTANMAHKPQYVLVKTLPPNAPPRNQQDLIIRELTPMAVRAEAKSNNSIQLSWIEPERPTRLANAVRINIIRYYVNSTATQTKQQDSSTQTNSTATNGPQYHYLNVTSPRESRLIVQKLKHNTEYAFAVKTTYYTPDQHRLLAQSGFSLDTVARTFDLEPPGPPRNFNILRYIEPTPDEIIKNNSAGTLELSWLSPELTNGNLKGFVILWTHDEKLPDTKWSRIYLNDSSANTWFVLMHRHSSPYFFRIRAINQRGESPDSDIRHFMSPAQLKLTPNNPDTLGPPIPQNNILLIIIILSLILFSILSLIVGKLLCSQKEGMARRKKRKASLLNQTNHNNNNNKSQNQTSDLDDIDGIGPTTVGNGNSSTVAARVGTLARRRDQNALKLQQQQQQNSDNYWINAMEQQKQAEAAGNFNGPGYIKQSNSGSMIHDKLLHSPASQQDQLNLTMVSIQRDSPQFATTQLAQHALPDYRLVGVPTSMESQFHAAQPNSHYHAGQFACPMTMDQMDASAANALMTMSRRQQQQMQKYRMEFGNTHIAPGGTLNLPLGSMSSQANGGGGVSAPSPNQQPPPPPPLNIEQQQQSLYGQHPGTRSLRLSRPTVYNPVSGSFMHQQQQQQQNLNTGATPTTIGMNPPNYTASSMAQQQLSSMYPHSFALPSSGMGSNTLQFAPSHHSTSTLMSRRSTNTTFRSQAGGGIYGQLGGINAKQYFMNPNAQILNQNNNNNNNIASMAQPAPQQKEQILQSHQAVINQLNQSSYPSLPLKHVSAVKPQIVSSLEDQVEMELAEKEHEQQQQANLQKQQQQLH